MINKIVITVFSILILVTTHFATYHYSKEAGVLEGITAYHRQCFEVGGHVFNEQDGSIVVCKGQGFLGEEEKKKLNASIVHQ